MHAEKNKDPDAILNEAVAGIRSEAIDEAAVARVGERVWERISAARPGSLPLPERIRGCADFQALLPAYRAGELPEARRLLVQDHLHECVVCRRAMQAKKEAGLEAARPRFASLAFAARWAMAAVVVLAAGLAAWSVWMRTPAQGGVVLAASDGPVYTLSGAVARPALAGQQIGAAEHVVTGRGARAMLRLGDGSQVELSDRTNLWVSFTRRDTTLNLARGCIIVQAAKRSSGDLYVKSQDCTVAVTGTVFAVNRGTKGSRVSVIEGQVRVAYAGNQAVLRPGEQVATHPSMAAVPVRDEIAWSRNFDRHLALLRELSAFQKQLETVRLPGLRYSSRLLGLVPEGTVIYASLPNLGRPLGDVQRIFQQQLQQSPALREWARKEADNVEQVLDKLRSLGEYLGEEVVVAVPADAAGKQADPLILAELARPGLRQYLESEWSRLQAKGGQPPSLRFIEDPARATAAKRELLIYLGRDLAAASTDLPLLQRVAELQAQPGANSFTRTPFHARIAEAYRNGVGLLVAADMERMEAVSQVRGKKPHAEAAFSNLRHLVIEHKEVAGKAENRAVVTFAGPRRGIASWLAEPAPMGALDFISPEANFVASFAVKSPTAALDDLLRMDRDIGEAQSELGLSLRDDVAAALGGEFALALDGPLLPVPSWKLVAEVYDPGRLQLALERFVAAINREGKVALRLDRETAGGRTFYALRREGTRSPFEAHYTFSGGYLVAAANRGLLTRALQQRETAYSLARAPQFTALLPRDRHANCSALLYQNLGPVIGPVAEALKGAQGLSGEQRQAVGALSRDTPPTLVCAYGEADQIQVASSGSFFGFGLSQLIGFGGPLGLPELLGHAMGGTTHRRNP